jgi:hypothetical protein
MLTQRLGPGVETSRRRHLLPRKPSTTKPNAGRFTRTWRSRVRFSSAVGTFNR